MCNEFVDKEANKFLIVLAVILTLTNLAAFGYIGYDKLVVDKKEQEKINEIKLSEKVVETRELTAKEYLNIDDKMNIYNKYFYNHYLLNKGEITNKEYMFFAYSMLNRDEKDITTFNMLDVLQEYFGDNKYTLDSIYCPVDDKVIYTYDKEKDVFLEEEHPSHGGSYYANSDIHYLRSEVKGDKATVVTKVLYERSCSDSCGEMNAYFKSMDDSLNNKNVILGDLDSNTHLVLTDSLYKTVEDSLPETTYNFTITKDGNYLLDSVTIK